MLTWALIAPLNEQFLVSRSKFWYDFNQLVSKLQILKHGLLRCLNLVTFFNNLQQLIFVYTKVLQKWIERILEVCSESLGHRLIGFA